MDITTTNNLALPGKTITAHFGTKGTRKQFMQLDLSQEEARELRDKINKIFPTFAVGAYVPQGELHPVLVPLVWDGFNWIACGPVVRKGGYLWYNLTGLFARNPVWLYGMEPCEF